jgi:hypothetical protein
MGSPGRENIRGKVRPDLYRFAHNADLGSIECLRHQSGIEALEQAAAPESALKE